MRREAGLAGAALGHVDSPRPAHPCSLPSQAPTSRPVAGTGRHRVVQLPGASHGGDTWTVNTSGPAIRPVLVNRYEQAADRLLRDLAEPGDRLLLKVGLKDALDLDRIPGLTSRERNYGLMAHLDFVMVDAETSTPRFAVELDGRQHWTDARTKERDAIKDSLCERALLPLLRVGSDFARTEGRWRVLDYLIAAFYRSEAFYRAQRDGEIPMDEPFYMGSFLAHDQDGLLTFDTLDIRAILRLRRLYQAGRLPAPIPDQYCTLLPEERSVQSHAFLAVAHDRYLVGKAKVRDFRFQGITPGDLAAELAIAEVGHLADQWLEGQPVAVNGQSLRKHATQVQHAIDQGQMLHCGTGAGLKPGGTAPTIAVHLGDPR